MAIRKRGNSWQIDHIDPNGKRVRKSFKKKKDAVAELRKAGVSDCGESLPGCKEGL